MTQSECEKAGIVALPVEQAECPQDRETRAKSHEPASPKAPKASAPKQTRPKATTTQSPKQITMTKAHKHPHPPGHTIAGEKDETAADAIKVSSPSQTGTKMPVVTQPSPKMPTTTPPQKTKPKATAPVEQVQTKTDTKKVSPAEGKQHSAKAVKPCKGKGTSCQKANDPLTMVQKTADVDKTVAAESKEENEADSPAMAKPFDQVLKPSKTVDRIVQSPDGKSHQLPPEEEKKKIDTAKKLEQLGLLPFSDDEDDDSSLETIASQDSFKLQAEPQETQSGNLMATTASKMVEEGEMTLFHKCAFLSARGTDTPAQNGINTQGWTISGSGKRKTKTVCETLMSPKGVANLVGQREATPSQTDSDTINGSGNNNRFAVLAPDNKQEEESSETTDVAPAGEVADASQQGAVAVHTDSNKAGPSGTSLQFSENPLSLKQNRQTIFETLLKNRGFRKTPRPFFLVESPHLC